MYKLSHRNNLSIWYFYLMFKKLKKYLIVGGFSFFFIKGLIWLVIIIFAYLGIERF